MTDWTNNPNLPANRYPWNRRGTNVRAALEQFLRVMRRAPGGDAPGRLEALQWLEGQLDKKPRDLFP